MARTRKRIAILISGRGSNMMSLVEAAASPGFPAEVIAVLSNRPEAAGLDWAAQRGIATRSIDHKAYPSREAFEADLQTALVACGAELVCLAGFMRVLTAGFVQRWQGRMLNIHPSLLPAFKGLDTHARALAAGVRIAGCTVHFVVPEMDAGPIVAQGAVPVAPTDTAGTLGARILSVEHRIYPHALRLVASGEVMIRDDGTAGPGVGDQPEINHSHWLISPPLPGSA